MLDGLYSILFVFEFLTLCKTIRINLSRISEDLPPISQFEDEEDVLILPYSLCKVIKASEEPSPEPFSIYLQYVSVPEQPSDQFLQRKTKIYH